MSASLMRRCVPAKYLRGSMLGARDRLRSARNSIVVQSATDRFLIGGYPRPLREHPTPPKSFTGGDVPPAANDIMASVRSSAAVELWFARLPTVVRSANHHPPFCRSQDRPGLCCNLGNLSQEPAIGRIAFQDLLTFLDQRRPALAVSFLPPAL